MAWRQQRAHGCGYRTSADGVGPGGGAGGGLLWAWEQEEGATVQGQGGKGLVKQVGDFRPLIQRTVESYGDILSRGLATSELHLRKV